MQSSIFNVPLHVLHSWQGCRLLVALIRVLPGHGVDVGWNSQLMQPVLHAPFDSAQIWLNMNLLNLRSWNKNYCHCCKKQERQSAIFYFCLLTVLFFLLLKIASRSSIAEIIMIIPIRTKKTSLPDAGLFCGVQIITLSFNFFQLGV